MSLKLEVGKRYLTRAGYATKPLERRDDTIFKYVAEAMDVYRSWDEHGMWNGSEVESLYDLISVIEDSPIIDKSPGSVCGLGAIEYNELPVKTLRDEFAMAAMAALITEPCWEEGTTSCVHAFATDDWITGPERYASVAYRFADAMMKEREK